MRLDFLRRVLAPDAGGADCQVIETHMSWVVLGTSEVLKMKKPGGHPVIDLSLPAVRRRNAHEEVRLNRRLAPDVYLGVLALEWRDGALWLAPDEAQAPGAAAIDWLVHMRRLPAGLMLDELLRGGRVEPARLRALGQRLAEFYAGARRVDLEGGAYVRRILDEQRANRAVLEDPRVGMASTGPTIDRFEEAVTRHSALLRGRAAEGRLVEGHGDLRPEHVCMLARPVVIDCLEFDATLREIDPVDELAFLVMEIELLGAGWIGRRLWRDCLDALADPAGEALQRLYTARRALLRARLCAAHLLGAPARDPAAWRARAGRYLRMADGVAGSLLSTVPPATPTPGRLR